jgi:hypothetical protein
MTNAIYVLISEDGRVMRFIHDPEDVAALDRGEGERVGNLRYVRFVAETDPAIALAAVYEVLDGRVTRLEDVLRSQLEPD